MGEGMSYISKYHRVGYRMELVVACHGKAVFVSAVRRVSLPQPAAVVWLAKRFSLRHSAGVGHHTVVLQPRNVARLRPCCYHINVTVAVHIREHHRIGAGNGSTAEYNGIAKGLQECACGKIDDDRRFPPGLKQACNNVIEPLPDAKR